MDQEGLSGHQACWMKCLSEFDFEVLYVPGKENMLPDVLSQMSMNLMHLGPSGHKMNTSSVTWT